jgi:hypothetical protein
MLDSEPETVEDGPVVEATNRLARIRRRPKST